MLNIGEELHGRYRIEALLGEGGMGAVYRAHDWLKKRYVAIKEFRLADLPSQTDIQNQENTQSRRSSRPMTREQALVQFRREAELLSQLNHPNLPEIYDFFSIGEQGYIVMTLVEGQDLYSYIDQKGPVSEEKVRNWLEQILSALEHCHAHGVIHRDLKPENLLLDQNGEIFLVDFGIAKSLAATSAMTTVGARGLTPGFSPPEQYAGTGSTDERSDIYALGAVLYFLLTGTSPMESTARQAGDPLILPRQKNPAISLQMESLILHCMALSKFERPQNVAELRKLLVEPTIGSGDLPVGDIQPVSSTEEERITGQPVENIPPKDTLEESEPPAINKNKRNWRLWVTLIGVVVLALAVIGIISILKGIAKNKPALTQPVAAAEATITPVPTRAPVTPVPTRAPVNPLPTNTELPPIPTTDPMVPPACTSIGQEWVSPMDGQTLVCVPAGSFQMGTTGQNCYDACAHTVELDPFWIDKTEITNQQFVEFLLNNLSSIRKESSTLIYWKNLPDPILDTNNFGMPLRILGDGTDLHADPGAADHPVYNVSWYGAQLYCESMGRRLPSEAEWELAARGTQSFTYPWGNTFDCSKANLGDLQTPQACDQFKDQVVVATSPVGSFPSGASPYGVMDMVGNVAEWVNDWYDVSYYYNSPLSNPAGPETGAEKIIRGWGGVPPEEMTFRRINMPPVDSVNLEGFRCAY